MYFSCEGCIFMDRIPWGKDRVGYRCMKQGDRYGRIVDTQLPQADPLLIKPLWCNEKEMGTKSTELRAALKAANYKKQTAFECACDLFTIVHSDEHLCSIVLEDIAAGKTVEQCEKEIESFARKHGGVGKKDAEKIIRNFFGLPEGNTLKNILDDDEPTQTQEQVDAREPAGKPFRLSDYMNS